MKDKLMPWRKQSMQHNSARAEHPLDMLHREVNELFETYFRGTTERFGRSTMASVGYEVSETDHEIRVKVELPGMDQKDIRVELDENMLIVQGERRERQEEKKRNYHVSQMSYGGYCRSIPLPASVEGDKTKARYKRGVLTLTLPKTKEARSARRRIEVSVD
ncbi:Hsp20/alpha crystallin family protein [Pontiellaceae bacterium B12227]|nr:Hsp20/alpha crystallin family protein [Pontiellaceae bacterium B12227]